MDDSQRDEPLHSSIRETTTCFCIPNKNLEGLKIKYDVFKVSDGSPVYNCFVLRPDRDHAAVEALRAYAATTENRALAADIIQWVGADPIKEG